MKLNKFSITSLALASLFMVSCHKEEGATPIGPDGPKKVYMTFSVASGSETKTTMDSTFIYWATKDEISVFDTTGENNEFALSKGAGSNSGEFSGSAVESDKYYAVYPYNSTVTCSISDSTFSGVVLPAFQSVPSGSLVCPEATVMVARSADKTNLRFSNLTSFIKFTPKADCQTIVIKSNGSEFMAGTGSVSVRDTSFTVTGAGSGSVTLYGDFKAETSYYAAVLPGTYTNGVTVDFISSGTVYSSTSEGPTTLKRGAVYNAGGGTEGFKYAVWTAGLSGASMTDRWDYCDSLSQNLFSGADSIAFKIRCNTVGENGTFINFLNDSSTVWFEYDFTQNICFICSNASEKIVTPPGANCTSMFSKYKATNQVSSFDFSNIFFPSIGNCSYMFRNCNKITEIDISNIQIQDACSDPNRMFESCEKLEKINGMEKFNPSKKNCEGIFIYCYALDSLDLSGMKLKSGDDINYMFFECFKLRKLILSPDFKATLAYRSGMFNKVGSKLTEGKCTVYGVTDEAEKAALSDSKTEWNSDYMQFAE